MAILHPHPCASRTFDYGLVVERAPGTENIVKAKGETVRMLSVSTARVDFCVWASRPE